jgi:hypothetical protein
MPPQQNLEVGGILYIGFQIPKESGCIVNVLNDTQLLLS